VPTSTSGFHGPTNSRRGSCPSASGFGGPAKPPIPTLRPSIRETSEFPLVSPGNGQRAENREQPRASGRFLERATSNDAPMLLRVLVGPGSGAAGLERPAAIRRPPFPVSHNAPSPVAAVDLQAQAQFGGTSRDPRIISKSGGPTWYHAGGFVAQFGTWQLSH